MESRPPAKGKANILLVEDDSALANVLVGLLESEGYRVWHAAGAAAAHDSIGEVRPDLVLLDIILPGGDGLMLCTELIERWPAPIVLLSATRRRSDPVLGLRLGADDFIAKPFDASNLLARLEAVLRRVAADWPRQPSEFPVYELGPLLIDSGGRSVSHDGNALQLSPTELRLLAALASEPERVFSREELASRVWSYASVAKGRVIDAHIHRVRRKLEEGGVTDPAVVTVRAYGYKLSHIAPG
jgi:two-component system response regulator MtrA